MKPDEKPKFKEGDVVYYKARSGYEKRQIVSCLGHDVSLNELVYSLRTVAKSGPNIVAGVSSLRELISNDSSPAPSDDASLRANGKTWRIKNTPDAALRKMQPIGTVLKSYFPLGFRGVAAVAHVGNEKHNPGTPLHWERGKSDDHLDCAARHLSESDDWDVTVLPDGRAFAVLHAAQSAWRALALAQLEAEKHSGRVIYELEPIPVGETAQDRP